MQHARQLRKTLQAAVVRRDSCTSGGRDSQAVGQGANVTDDALTRRVVEQYFELYAAAVLGDGIVVVGAGEQQEATVIELRADRQAFPFFRRAVAQEWGVGREIEQGGDVLGNRHEARAGRIQIDGAYIGGPGDVDLEHLLVRQIQVGVNPYAAVVAFQHHELAIIEGYQRRDAAPLARPFHTDKPSHFYTLFNIANTNPASNLFALASDCRLVNLTGTVDLNLFNPVHLMLTGDYVKNVGFSRAKTLARTGVSLDTDTTGYMAQVAVGMPSMALRGDWQLSLGYRRLGADAVLDAFTDSDFHLGGTNNKGFFLGAQYGLGKNSWLTARWLSSNEVKGLPLSIHVLQVYFNAKF